MPREMSFVVKSFGTMP